MVALKYRVLLGASLATLSLLSSATRSFAAMQSLNGQSGQNQTFSNDTNVTISSSGNVHSLGWSGVLSVLRGGTGASSFSNGSLLFFNGSTFAQDNSNLYWDNTNKRLGIGTSSPTVPLSVNGSASILGGDLITESILGMDATTSNTDGSDLSMFAGAGLGTGNGGNLELSGGDGGITGNGGALEIRGGIGGVTSGDGGPVNIFAGFGQGTNFNGSPITLYGATGNGTGIGSTISLLAGNGGATGDGGPLSLQAGNGGQTSGKGGSITFNAGSANGGNSDGGNISFQAGAKSGSGSNGTIKFYNPQSGTPIVLDLASINTSDKTFTFPNTSGTFGLLESGQTWSGLNKFEASSNSTVYVGSSTKSGCIALGDSTGSGIYYITINSGTLTASSTKPSICQ